MKVRASYLLLGILCAGPAAEAGLLGHHEPSLPKPYDFPMPPPRTQDYRNKPGNVGQHSEKYVDPNWGRDKKRVLKIRDAHFTHSLFQR